MQHVWYLSPLNLANRYFRVALNFALVFIMPLRRIGRRDFIPVTKKASFNRELSLAARESRPVLRFNARNRALLSLYTSLRKFAFAYIHVHRCGSLNGDRKRR